MATSTERICKNCRRLESQHTGGFRGPCEKFADSSEVVFIESLPVALEPGPAINYREALASEREWFAAQVLAVAEGEKEKYPKGKAVENIVCSVLYPLTRALAERIKSPPEGGV